MINLDTLLYGNPSWAEVVEYFKDGEFYEESYLVEAIKQHLRTPDDKKQLYDADLSIEDCLNGRYGGGQEGVVNGILKGWNEKLGFKQFFCFD